MKIPAQPVIALLLCGLLAVQLLWHGIPGYTAEWSSLFWLVPLLVMLVGVRRPDSVSGIIAALVLLIYLIYGVSEAMTSTPRWPGMLQAALSAAFILGVAISAKRPKRR